MSTDLVRRVGISNKPIAHYFVAKSSAVGSQLFIHIRLPRAVRLKKGVRLLKKSRKLMEVIY